MSPEATLGAVGGTRLAAYALVCAVALAVLARARRRAARKPAGPAEAGPREPSAGAASASAQGPARAGWEPVGTFASVYVARNMTPNQPSRVPRGRGCVALRRGLGDALDGLEAFSHVWLLFVFSDNKDGASKNKVLPPRKRDGLKTGLFACRAPNRPNPIGLSLVRLDRVDRERSLLFVSGHDLLDGTPM
jgi:tRNA-Thr(GGU) m(6)t(6)A37 methyltransferase TsaA